MNNTIDSLFIIEEQYLRGLRSHEEYEKGLKQLGYPELVDVPSSEWDFD